MARIHDCSYLYDEENCAALELERACYNEMERESVEYFYAAEKELSDSARGFDSWKTS